MPPICRCTDEYDPPRSIEHSLERVQGSPHRLHRFLPFGGSTAIRVAAIIPRDDTVRKRSVCSPKRCGSWAKSLKGSQTVELQGCHEETSLMMANDGDDPNGRRIIRSILLDTEAL